MSKTLIVPGLDGSPAPHWQDWWARTDPNAMIVDLPDPRRPAREAWEAALAVMILRHPHSILVGHSLGSVLIAQMLARWSGLKVRGAMLVAPADPMAPTEQCRRIQKRWGGGAVQVQDVQVDGAVQVAHAVRVRLRLVHGRGQ